jgi:hypothetical protein
MSELLSLIGPISCKCRHFSRLNDDHDGNSEKCPTYTFPRGGIYVPLVLTMNALLDGSPLDGLFSIVAHSLNDFVLGWRTLSSLGQTCVIK